MRSPLRELDYQTPIRVLDTVTGYGLVDRVPGRIDYGIFGSAMAIVYQVVRQKYTAHPLDVTGT